MSLPALRLVQSHPVTPTVSELSLTIKEFLITMQGEGLSSRTLRHYAWHLERLEAWLASRGIGCPADISRLLLREWAASLYEPYTVNGKAKVWGPAIIKQAVTSARSFLVWCAKDGYCDESLAGAIKTPKIKKRQQRTLTQVEIERLHRGCDLGTSKGLRDRALLGLLLDSGLRAAEVCRVEVGALEYGVLVGADVVNRCKVIIKGGNEEYAYFSDQTAGYLRDWLAVRLAAPGVRTVFVSVGGLTPGRQLTVEGLGKALRNLGDTVGVKGVSPHVFRRTFAVMLTLLGVPSRAVQVLGRWSDIRMVEHYTSGLVAGQVFSQYAGRLWGVHPELVEGYILS